jgi:hypothetical protein
MRTVDQWSTYLKDHPKRDEYVKAVRSMQVMLRIAVLEAADLTDAIVAEYHQHAVVYHHTMLRHFPKSPLRGYEHALLVHLPELLRKGQTLLDGSSWFLEAFNKVWKRMLLRHTNNGGGRPAATQEQQQAEQPALRLCDQQRQTMRLAKKRHDADMQAMKDMCVLTDPVIAAIAAEWAQPSSVQAALLTAAGA